MGEFDNEIDDMIKKLQSMKGRCACSDRQRYSIMQDVRTLTDEIDTFCKWIDDGFQVEKKHKLVR